MIELHMHIEILEQLTHLPETKKLKTGYFSKLQLGEVVHLTRQENNDTISCFS